MRGEKSIKCRAGFPDPFFQVTRKDSLVHLVIHSFNLARCLRSGLVSNMGPELWLCQEFQNSPILSLLALERNVLWTFKSTKSLKMVLLGAGQATE